MERGKFRGSFPAMHCPHCRTRAHIRSSRDITDLVREARYRCTNDHCGHIFMTRTEILYSIVPSVCARPEIVLPLGRANGRQRPANDDMPAPANDDRRQDEAADAT